MSEFRVEKGKARAVLTLADGSTVRGCFFVASSSATVEGPERVKDLLSDDAGFFPFEVTDADRRARPAVQPRARGHGGADRRRRAAPRSGLRGGDTPLGVAAAVERRAHLQGTVLVHRPHGRDRLSDFARSKEPFRYVDIPGATLIVNAAHIVELSETES